MDQILEIDVATNTFEIRPMTDDESSRRQAEAAQVKKDAEAVARAAAELEMAKQSARAKLAALGLTDDEVNALIR